MASIYKRKGRRKWLIEYSDENKKRRTVTGSADKEVTKQIAAKLESDAKLRRMGVIDASVERCAEAERKPLVVKDADDKIVGGHLADFHAALLAKGNTAKHSGAQRTQVAKLIDACGTERISDLTASTVQWAINELRQPRGEDKPGLSLQTCNHYLRSAKSFSRWLWKDRRTREDALAHLASYNVQTDRRHQRRAISDTEFARVLAAAEAGQDVLGMSGRDRRFLYVLAAGTGFRRGELRSLTPESFDLDANPPTVTVEAGYSKRRRRDVQPIRRDLAELLRPWLADRPAGEPILTIPDDTSEMIQVDLAASGIPYKDGAGRVFDFHALRGQYITTLVRGKVTVKEAQELARHSTPILTMNVYTDLSIHDKSRALEALPPVSSGEPEKQAAQATGTYDDRPNPKRRAVNAPGKPGTRADKGEQSGTSPEKRHGQKKACNAQKKPVSEEETGEWERVDLNHRRLSRQIYSLIPLTTRAHSQRPIPDSTVFIVPRQARVERKGKRPPIWPRPPGRPTVPRISCAIARPVRSQRVASPE